MSISNLVSTESNSVKASSVESDTAIFGIVTSLGQINSATNIIAAGTIEAAAVQTDGLFAASKDNVSVAYGATMSVAIAERQGTVTILGAGAMTAGLNIELSLTGPAAIIGGTDQCVVWQGPGGADAIAQSLAINTCVQGIGIGVVEIQIANISAGTYTAAGGTDIVLSYMMI